MRFKLFVAATALLSATLIARADTVTYDFTYSSTSGAVAGETATGNGSFTLNYTPGLRTGTLSAFSFTDTIDSPVGDSTFTYSGINHASGAFVLTLGGDLVDATITTSREFGTIDEFGPVDFMLQDIQGTINDSTSGGNIAPESFYGNTTGSGTVTFVGRSAVTPEPSSFLLLGTGMLGVVGVIKRRLL